MKPRLTSLLPGFFFLALLFSPVLEAKEGALALQRRLVDVFEQNRGAVLKVVAAFDAEEPDGRNFLLIGTGFYVSREGHILTNSNIVFGANRVWVERKGIAYAAEKIGHDPLTNVSILRVLKLPHDFEFLRFTDMPDLPAVGSLVVSIGCELGLEPSPSLGLITGWNTQYVERILPTVYLRTNIPYDGGEGGSPVFDLNGSLIGMVVAALPEIRSSFVLPARAVQRILNDIILSGEVTYAYFGFQSRQMANPERGPWVEVEYVAETSPAEEAGIQPGDILRRIGDFTIDTDDDLRTASFFARPHRYISVTVKRDEEEIELSLMPGVREVPITAMPPVGVADPAEDPGTEAQHGVPLDPSGIAPAPDRAHDPVAGMAPPMVRESDDIEDGNDGVEGSNGDSANGNGDQP